MQNSKSQPQKQHPCNPNESFESLTGHAWRGASTDPWTLCKINRRARGVIQCRTNQTNGLVDWRSVYAKDWYCAPRIQPRCIKSKVKRLQPGSSRPASAASTVFEKAIMDVRSRPWCCFNWGLGTRSGSGIERRYEVIAKYADSNIRSWSKLSNFLVLLA
jgi:hypothetical protein